MTCGNLRSEAISKWPQRDNLLIIYKQGDHLFKKTGCSKWRIQTKGLLFQVLLHTPHFYRPQVVDAPPCSIRATAIPQKPVLHALREASSNGCISQQIYVSPAEIHFSKLLSPRYRWTVREHLYGENRPDKAGQNPHFPVVCGNSPLLNPSICPWIYSPIDQATDQLTTEQSLNRSIACLQWW